MANVIISGALYNKLITAERLYNDIRYALRKDEAIDESVSCIRDIPSDVEMIEDLKKRAADSDCYKEKSELLEEKLKNANELADSWKRDYERLRDRFVHPMCNILYPDKPDLNINLTDILNDIKNLKVYADENGQMYKELQEWREKCISRGNDIDHLLSENKEKDKKIGELQNIVTEKEVEIKGLRKDNVRLNKDISWGNMIAEKNTELNQTISDQGVTIKALLITIKEMCKEDETNE